MGSTSAEWKAADVLAAAELLGYRKGPGTGVGNEVAGGHYSAGGFDGAGGTG